MMKINILLHDCDLYIFLDISNEDKSMEVYRFIGEIDNYFVNKLLKIKSNGKNTLYIRIPEIHSEYKKVMIHSKDKLIDLIKKKFWSVTMNYIDIQDLNEKCSEKIYPIEI